MKRGLKKNICQLDDFINLSEVEDLPTLRTKYIGEALKYAYQFWTNHLVEMVSGGPDVEEICKAIDEFFTTYFLFWVEVLSLMEKLDVSVYALRNVDQWYLQVGHMLSIC